MRQIMPLDKELQNNYPTRQIDVTQRGNLRRSVQVTMPLHQDHVLCVEDDRNIRESRCMQLESFGYHSVSASPRFAEILLLYKRFDLVVLSVADDHDLNRIINLAEGADILVLSEFGNPDDLPSMVADRLRRLEMKSA
jgi:CheY-like chemotaxis protein